MSQCGNTRIEYKNNSVLLKPNSDLIKNSTEIQDDYNGDLIQWGFLSV